MVKSVIVLLVLAFCASLAWGQEMSTCNYTTTTGNHFYNLLPLKVAATKRGEYYNHVHTEAGDTYTLFVNICQDASLAGCAPASTASCQDNGSGTLTNCGVVTSGSFKDYVDPTTNKAEAGKGVILSYGGGKVCGTNPRVTNVVIQCDKSATTPAVLSVEEPSPCNYELLMKSSHGCPVGGGGGGGGLDGGWVFIIILFVGFVVYIGVGIAVKKLHFHAEGSDMMPNKEFWSALPGLVKDGVVYFFGCVTSPCRGGYSEV